MTGNWVEIQLENRNVSFGVHFNLKHGEKRVVFPVEKDLFKQPFPLQKPSKFWGEVLDIPFKVVPDLRREIDMAMRFQEEASFNATQQELKIPPADPLVLHAISLRKYLNNVTELKKLTKLASETNLIPENAAPPLPVLPQLNRNHSHNTLGFFHKKDTNFTRGAPVDIPDLREDVLRSLSRKTIALLFAHIGFEKCHFNVLDVLVDVLEAFFHKICKELASATYDEEVLNSFGFPNAIERVLTDCGLGGMAGLHDYYQSRVVKYVNVLEKKCKKLEAVYAQLLRPNNHDCSSLDKEPMVKTELAEEEVFEVDINEISSIE